MASRQKSYFLTLDEVRIIKQQSDGRVRVGRKVRAQKKLNANARILKEKTTVLTTRISASAYSRFTTSIRYEPFTEGSSNLGRFVEEALLLFLAYKAFDCAVLHLTCSPVWYAKLRPVLAGFRRKRKRGAVAQHSKSYSYFEKKYGQNWQVYIFLPPARPNLFKKRISMLADVMQFADQGVIFWKKGQVL